MLRRPRLRLGWLGSLVLRALGLAALGCRSRLLGLDVLAALGVAALLGVWLLVVGLVRLFGHRASISIGFGFCAACGCSGPA